MSIMSDIDRAKPRPAENAEAHYSVVGPTTLGPSLIALSTQPTIMPRVAVIQWSIKVYTQILVY